MLKEIPYCFTRREIIKNFKNKAQFNNWIRTRIKNHTIKRVRNGLYVTLDSMGATWVSKFYIATKISDKSFVAYHSALEYYGISPKFPNEIVVGNSSRFNEFEFEDVDYSCKVVKNYEQVEYNRGDHVRVTSLERTIVDCIDNIDMAYGICELLNALEVTRSLDEHKLLKALASYHRVILYQKVGFILEHYKKQLKLSDRFFRECRKHLTGQVKYFLTNKYQDVALNKTWNLIAPTDLLSHIRQGLPKELFEDENLVI